MLAYIVGFALSACVLAGDPGVAPRRNPADYAVHQTVDSVTIAASIVPADQVRKIFSPVIAKQYVVVECAFYPASGHTVNIDRFGFSLKTGPDTVARAERPRDAAAPWPGRNPGHNGPITTESGVYVAKGTGPAGKSTEVGTWETVEVGDGRRDPMPPPPPPPDTQIVEEKLAERALAEGWKSDPVAGFLYFPRYAKKNKTAATELYYLQDNLDLRLTFPK